MKILNKIILLILLSTLANLASAQIVAPRSNSGVSSGNSMQVLTNRTLQIELDLTDEQAFELEELYKSFSREREELLANMRASNTELRNDQQRREKIANAQQRVRDLEADVRAKIDQVLLPSQKTRLGQVSLQLRLRNDNQLRSSPGILSDEMVDLLRISELQQQRIRKKAQEIYKELEVEIQRLREEAENEIREELTTKQREKLSELIGEPIVPIRN